jgi:exonuclease SbcC
MSEGEIWRHLSALIGSADGQLFRHFAQGLTLQRLMIYANEQLSRLNKRYVLCQGDSSLDIVVIDREQLNYRRSASTLSGGETFLVSLALALGLSQMSSRGATFNSLFIDEGFGTLDNDSLDLALEALSSLQSDGKLIGLISHIPAAKDRIQTQIQVIKKGGGFSSLEGPGITQIS